MTRGFIQIAGFTFGKATSFFDFVSTAAVAYNAGMVHSSDTGDAGQIVASYTAQFGNGLSSTLSFEQTRRAATTFLEPAGAAFSLASLTGASCNDLAQLGAGNSTTASTCDVGCRTSSATSASIRPGAPPRSPARCTTSAPVTSVFPRPPVIRATRGASRSAPVCA